MKNKTEKRGGPRPNSGRPTIPEDQKSVKDSVYLTPENFKFRQEMGRAWNRWLNQLIEEKRNQI